MADSINKKEPEYLEADGYRHELINVESPKVEDIEIAKESKPEDVLNTILFNAQLTQFPYERWSELKTDYESVLANDKITGANTPVEVLKNMVLHSEAKIKVGKEVDISKFYSDLAAVWQKRGFSANPGEVVQ